MKRRRSRRPAPEPGQEPKVADHGAQPPTATARVSGRPSTVAGTVVFVGVDVVEGRVADQARRRRPRRSVAAAYCSSRSTIETSRRASLNCRAGSRFRTHLARLVALVDHAVRRGGLVRLARVFPETCVSVSEPCVFFQKHACPFRNPACFSRNTRVCFGTLRVFPETRVSVSEPCVFFQKHACPFRNPACFSRNTRVRFGTLRVFFRHQKTLQTVRV